MLPVFPGPGSPSVSSSSAASPSPTGPAAHAGTIGAGYSLSRVTSVNASPRSGGMALYRWSVVGGIPVLDPAVCSATSVRR